MQKPWLSLLIPVFNCKDFLEDCLASILVSIPENTEILFYDDASTDGSRALLEAFATRSIRGLSVLYAQSNGGLSVARNQLLAAAKGEYVWFLDADDYLLPGALSTLREVVDCHAPDGIIFDYRTVSEQVDIADEAPDNSRYVKAFGGPAHCLLNDKNTLFSGLFERRRLQAWARVFRRDIWQAGALFPAGKYFEDIPSVSRTSLELACFYYLPRAMVAYRRRHSSIVRSPCLNKVDDLMAAPRGVLEYWQARGIVLNDKSRFAYYSFCITNFVNAVKLLRQGNLADKERIGAMRERLFCDFGFGLSKLVLLHIKHRRIWPMYRALRYLYAGA